MKILWVKAGGLVPPDVGGRIRSYNILKELARTQQVTVFTYYAEQPDDPHPQLKPLFDHVEYYPLKIPATKGFSEAMLYARHSVSPLPYSVAKYSQPHVARSLRKLVERSGHDVIVCDFVVAGGVIPWDVRCPKVLFTHNVEALIWERHYQVARNPLWKVICRQEYRKMERLERAYLERADLVLTVSDFDRNYFTKFISPAKIAVIPTGVDVNYFQPAAGTELPGRLVFSGSMDWMANEDGIIFFVDEILPRIRAEIPTAELEIIGRSPSPVLRALAAKTAGVSVTGRVDDIRPYVHRGAVYVVPLRVGSGTRLKIFEAMAMGKAIVSTSIGAEGLPVEHGKNIILADEPAEFARQVVHLLNSPSARSELGKAARLLVERNYSWSVVAGKFEFALSRACQT
ncbi:MAG: glycosyltransferase [Terriglobia bacterium]